MLCLTPRFAFAALVMLVLAIAVPAAYTLVFGVEVAPTQLFYSPVRKAFVFREHHGAHDFIYADQHGERFDRRTFETQIPFIYYRNMDLWGLLPITLDGQTFDAVTMRDTRQILELAPREIRDRRPEIDVYPLLEANPGRARLQFPEDVFRMTADAMEFLNVDTNTVDTDLTTRFTMALTAAGFAFPAGLVAGKPTILKPLDEGYFLVDAAGAVFHVKRVDGRPQVVRTPIPTDLGIRHIKVSETRSRAFYGLLLTDDARLFLITYDAYRLVPLPVESYDPDRMAYKLLLNPMQATAVFGDEAMIHAVAMTRDFQPFDRYARPVPGTADMVYARLARWLFPYTVHLDEHNGGYLTWRLTDHGWTGVAGIGIALLTLLAVERWRRSPWRAQWPKLVLVVAGGLFGLLACLLLPERRAID